MWNFIDLTGQKFGKLTVLERCEDYVSPKGDKKVMWKCICDCGNFTLVCSGSLKSGHTKSCGCSAKDFEDLTGQKFNRLTPIKRIKDYKTNKKLWLCKCDCGNNIAVKSSDLKTGRIKSCGCIKKEKIVCTGEKEKRLYRIWCAIKTRCYNKNSITYKNYGARGIKMCDEWFNNFSIFCKWALNNNYNNDLSIDRIDVNGNYEPSNCRWVSKKEQARNTRKNKLYTYKNETKCLAEWCEELNLNYKVVSSRINRHKWSVEEAFETPTKIATKLIKYNNETKPLKQWCKELDLNYSTISTRLQRNWDIERAFKTPIKNKF